MASRHKTASRLPPWYRKAIWIKATSAACWVSSFATPSDIILHPSCFPRVIAAAGIPAAYTEFHRTVSYLPEWQQTQLIAFDSKSTSRFRGRDNFPEQFGVTFR